MARGRIFSSRRMFSTRRDAFAEPSRNAGPMGVVLGLLAAGIIIFAIGVYIGAKFPSTFGFGTSAPAPVAATPPDAEAPVVTFAPETPSEAPAETSVEPAPDAATPDTTPVAPVETPATTPAPATSAPVQTSPATPAPATP